MKEWGGWPWLGAAAVAILILVIFYSGYTLHQHNADLNCLVNANRVVAADVHNAIAHDKNPSDYQLVPGNC